MRIFPTLILCALLYQYVILWESPTTFFDTFPSQALQLETQEYLQKGLLYKIYALKFSRPMTREVTEGRIFWM